MKKKIYIYIYILLYNIYDYLNVTIFKKIK